MVRLRQHQGPTWMLLIHLDAMKQIGSPSWWHWEIQRVTKGHRSVLTRVFVVSVACSLSWVDHTWLLNAQGCPIGDLVHMLGWWWCTKRWVTNWGKHFRTLSTTMGQRGFTLVTDVSIGTAASSLFKFMFEFLTKTRMQILSVFSIQHILLSAF